MATKEQIKTLLEQLKKAPPSEHFQNIDRNVAGMRAILEYLSQTDEKVTAGKISEHMRVSTARVTVLLKKMVAKGLIEKENDPLDARVVVVKLSEQGKRAADKVREAILGQIGAMIDKVGIERMLEFAAISNEIHSVMKTTNIDIDF